MSTKSLIFLLVAVFTIGFAANTCRIGTVVHRPNNNQTYSFPTNWNETHSAPHLAADQSCSWVVTIPQGYYAKIIIAGKINDTVGHFQIIDGNGNVFMTTHENKEPYYLPGPKFTLIMENEAPATFAFKIIWLPFPNIDEYEAGIYFRAHVLNITQELFGASFSAKQISLMAFPADIKHPYSLRSALVFLGADANGTYLTNLYEIYKSKTEYVAPVGLVYITNVEASGNLDQLLVQDAEFTNDLHPYKQLICESNSGCVKTLDGSPNGPSGLAYCGPKKQKLTAISMDTTAQFQLYYDSRNPLGPYTVYNGSSIQSLLPLTFDGNFVSQYIITSGKATMTFDLID